MHINIHIFTGSMSHSPERFVEEMDDLLERIRNHIRDSVINNRAGAIGNQTFLDEVSNYVLATITVDKNAGSG